MPTFVTIARRRIRLFLSEHEGHARPDTLVYLHVRDVEAIAAEFGISVEEAPWAREIEIVDIDGNRLWIGTPDRIGLDQIHIDRCGTAHLAASHITRSWASRVQAQDLRFVILLQDQHRVNAQASR